MKRKEAEERQAAVKAQLLTLHIDRHLCYAITPAPERLFHVIYFYLLTIIFASRTLSSLFLLPSARITRSTSSLPLPLLTTCACDMVSYCTRSATLALMWPKNGDRAKKRTKRKDEQTDAYILRFETITCMYEWNLKDGHRFVEGNFRWSKEEGSWAVSKKKLKLKVQSDSHK